MVRALTALVVLSLAAVQPAAKPDFTGEWKMNPAKSDFGVLPPPTAMTRSITHAEPSLTIVEDQESGLGSQKATRKYVTDGSPSSFETNGVTVNSSATWNERVLVVVSKVDAISAAFNDTMSLSADGQTLTSVVHISTPQGDVDLTVVFEKQK